MDKHEFIKYLAAKSQLKGRTQAFYADVLEEILTGLTEQLRAKKTVRFLGFGTFVLEERKGGSVKSIKTGEPISYPPYKAVRFRIGEKLRSALNK